jgi:hypothetical protein
MGNKAIIELHMGKQLDCLGAGPKVDRCKQTEAFMVRRALVTQCPSHR